MGRRGGKRRAGFAHPAEGRRGDLPVHRRRRYAAKRNKCSLDSRLERRQIFADGKGRTAAGRLLAMGSGTQEQTKSGASAAPVHISGCGAGTQSPVAAEGQAAHTSKSEIRNPKSEIEMSLLTSAATDNGNNENEHR